MQNERKFLVQSFFDDSNNGQTEPIQAIIQHDHNYYSGTIFSDRQKLMDQKIDPNR